MGANLRKHDCTETSRRSTISRCSSGENYRYDEEYNLIRDLVRQGELAT